MVAVVRGDLGSPEISLLTSKASWRKLNIDVRLE